MTYLEMIVLKLSKSCCRSRRCGKDRAQHCCRIAAKCLARLSS